MQRARWIGWSRAGAMLLAIVVLPWLFCETSPPDSDDDDSANDDDSADDDDATGDGNVSTHGGWQVVDTGFAHTCALKEGFAHCWGADEFGQSQPIGAEFATVTAGYQHGCGLVVGTGAVECWGRSMEGQIAEQTDEIFQDVDAGYYHTCGLRSDGTISCWGCYGNESWGQCDAPPGTFTAVSAGHYHTCGLSIDGSVVCWGCQNGMDYGQCFVPPGPYQAIASGAMHVCGLLVDGSISCWGFDVAGSITPPVDWFQAVAAGGAHSCAVRLGGTLTCWGSDAWAQSPYPHEEDPGDDDDDSATGDDDTDGPTGGDDDSAGDDDTGDDDHPGAHFTAVSAHAYHTCALRDDGYLVCWGCGGATDDGQCDPP